MNIHPAIDPKELDVWNACRQLMLPGARVEVTNYSWQAIKRDAFDCLYFSGLALRHSNGATGKYETFTYTPTEQLLAWACQQDLLRASFDDALKGRDVKNEIRNLRRRARYAEQQDRAKFFPKDTEVKHRVLVESQSPLSSINQEGDFSSPGMTQWYVAEFCRLNGLKP